MQGCGAGAGQPFLGQLEPKPWLWYRITEQAPYQALKKLFKLYKVRYTESMKNGYFWSYGTPSADPCMKQVPEPWQKYMAYVKIATLLICAVRRGKDEQMLNVHIPRACWCACCPWPPAGEGWRSPAGTPAASSPSTSTAWSVPTANSTSRSKGRFFYPRRDFWGRNCKKKRCTACC